jgi:starch phosphorylase
LAYNFRWAWDRETVTLFHRMDRDLWEETGHNPVALLGSISQETLDSLAVDEGFVTHYHRAIEELDDYLNGETWFEAHRPGSGELLVAYFSAEFGVTECLSIFAGGLGVLAGDHLKSASDLGIPLVGVGLLYQRGYFRQTIDAQHRQVELLWRNDFENLPLTLERALDGSPLVVSVGLPGREVAAQIWKAQVGRVALYLLDTNVPQNSPEDREITGRLYDGSSEMRIKQEIMLGIGGCRALQALGIEPTVYHMNEGHAAYLALERVGSIMNEQGVDFATAREAASAGIVFTSHTPVPAGHDRFPPEMMDQYFSDYWQKVGLSRETFLGLGRERPEDPNELFTMTTLALKTASYSNGVSKLHGAVTRQMWQGLWPEMPVDEVPIGYVTNGVHLPSWISDEMLRLYDRYLGPRWRDEVTTPEFWQQAHDIPAGELWTAHQRRRERLVSFVRTRLVAQLEQRDANFHEIEAVEDVLDPNILTIGFARRFATYKRATLLLRDRDRLARILNDEHRPAQMIFSGKAHPRDEGGKELIRQIAELRMDERFARKIVFVPDYEMAVARYLVQGVDVWLNNPRRPLEASGTSGMKVAANGGLNFSTLDGWWDEAWAIAGEAGEPVGWAIGNARVYEDTALGDELEAQALYDVLEHEVVPTFYDRGRDGLPGQWVRMMQNSLSLLPGFFNTNRMVWEYLTAYYEPTSQRYQCLTANRFAGAKELASWRQRVVAGWPAVRVEALDASPLADVRSGGSLTVTARAFLGELKPEDVRVELYSGRLGADGEIVDGEATLMAPTGVVEEGWHVYQADSAGFATSGRYGYSIRVLPTHYDLTAAVSPTLIRWST